MSREDVFIANVLKCRPPGNRDPQPLEIEACRPYLFEQVRLIEPRVVCHPGQLRDQAAQRQPDRDHQGAGHAAGPRARGPHRLPAAALPPGGGAADAGRAETLRGDFEAIPELLAEPLPGLGAEERQRRADREPRDGGARRARARPARVLRLSAAAETSRPPRPRRPRRSAPGSPSGLAPGDVVVVSGEVGAGKTTLIRGACRALGVEGPVTSPTFTIGRRYRGGRIPVSHLDLYRLEQPRARGPGPARRLPRPRLGRLHRVVRAGGAASAGTILRVSLATRAAIGARSRSAHWLGRISSRDRSERPCSPSLPASGRH